MTQPNQDKPYTTRPTTQLDLERRTKEGFKSGLAKDQQVDPEQVNRVAAPYAVEGNDTSQYVGVDADRMTYAEETHKPFAGEGVEAETSEELLSGYAYGKDAVKEGKQTVGTGSSAPVVGVATSGEGVSHKVVDRQKVADKAKEQEDKLREANTAGPLQGVQLKETTEELGAVSDGKGSTETSESAAPAEPTAPKKVAGGKAGE